MTSELIKLGDQKGSTSNVLHGQETFFHKKTMIVLLRVEDCGRQSF